MGEQNLLCDKQRPVVDLIKDVFIVFLPVMVAQYQHFMTGLVPSLQQAIIMRSSFVQPFMMAPP